MKFHDADQHAQVPAGRLGVEEDDRVRVALVNKFYLPIEGGVERHVADLVQGLSGLPTVSNVSVLAAGTSRVRESRPLPNGELIRLPSLGRFASAPLADFRPGLRDLKADIYHFHFPNPPGELAWLAMGKASGKLVVTYHSDIVRQRLLLLGYGPFLKRFLRRADRILVTSPSMVENSPWLQELVDKVRVVPLGIDTSRFAPTPTTLEAAGELRKRWTGPVVLFVGRLVYYKGLPTLLEAMRGQVATLVIAGEGPMRAELEAKAEALGLGDRVCFLGRVQDHELPALYRAADLFVLPSTHRSEAFGLVQVEAHASGIPVISTRLTTGVPWVNAHGETGLTVPPGDVQALREALERLLSDDDLRLAMGRRAAERAEREFSQGVMCQRVIEVYSEVLA